MQLPTWNAPTSLTPDAIERRRRLAEALMTQGMDTSPVQHWTQGAARLAQALAGSSQMARADKADATLRREAELKAATEKAKAEQKAREAQMMPDWKFTDQGIYDVNPYRNPNGPLLVQQFQKKQREWKKLNDGTLYRDGEDGPEFAPVPGGQGAKSEYQAQFDKQTAKKNADLSAKIDAAALDAETQLNNLDRMEQLSSDPDVYQGPLAESSLWARKAIANTGLGDKIPYSSPQAVGKSDELASLSNSMALMVRNPDAGLGMPGALSDQDREFLKSTVPGLGRSPGGNKQMIEAARRVNQRKREVAQLKAAYVEQNGQLDDGFVGVVQQYANENPLFEDLAGASGAPAESATKPRLAVPIQSDEEFERLPRGALFIGPDGKTRRKP